MTAEKIKLRDDYKIMWIRFGRIFGSIRAKERSASLYGPDMKYKVYNFVAKAAISKCIDFNVTASRVYRHEDQSFTLVSNLRGIVEDLICLIYYSRFTPAQIDELIQLSLSQDLADGIAAQRTFFEQNNPYQRVLGGSMPAAKAQERKTDARDALRVFWKSVGATRRDGPTVRDMAEDIGLLSTYEYIYFVASNFVHFHPHNLLRTGWNEGRNGPYYFSLRHMSTYYQTLAVFYGSILFLAFHAAFSPHYFETDLSKEVDRLIKLIGQIERWPEIITFEEMNERPPPFILSYALRRGAESRGETVPYGAILHEARSVRIKNVVV